MPNEMRSRPISPVWLVGYALVMAGVLGGLIYARSVAIGVYGSTVAQEEWDAWRDDATKMSAGSGPVTRRIPKSPQPPALVLMRDYFVACVVIALVLSTVLYGTVMLLIRGVLSTPAFVDRSLPERKR